MVVSKVGSWTWQIVGYADSVDSLWDLWSLYRHLLFRRCCTAVSFIARMSMSLSSLLLVARILRILHMAQLPMESTYATARFS